MKKEMKNYNKQWLWLGVIVFFMLVLVLPRFFIENSDIQLNTLSEDSSNSVGELGSMGAGDFPSNPAGGIPGVTGPTYSGPTPARKIPNIPSTPSPSSESPPAVVVINDKTKCSLSCSAETKLIQIDNTHYRLTVKKGERYNGGLGLGNLDENSIVVYDIGKVKAEGIAGSFVFANRSGNRIIVESKSRQNLSFEVIVNPDVNVPSGTSLGTITIPCDRRRVDIKSQPQTVIKKDSIDLKIEVVMVDCGAIALGNKKLGEECGVVIFKDSVGREYAKDVGECGSCLVCEEFGLKASVGGIPPYDPYKLEKGFTFLPQGFKFKEFRKGKCFLGYQGQSCSKNGQIGFCKIIAGTNYRDMNINSNDYQCITTCKQNSDCPSSFKGRVCGNNGLPTFGRIIDWKFNSLYYIQIDSACENNQCIPKVSNLNPGRYPKDCGKGICVQSPTGKLNRGDVYHFNSLRSGNSQWTAECK